MRKKFNSIFPFVPTEDQERAIDSLLKYTESSMGNQLFVLRGYAGTGKTTLISSYIKLLHELEVNYFLMAPTGRAAKVLSGYCGFQALTIHKSIYVQTSVEGKLHFALQKNKLSNAVFIVDEASMIGNVGGMGGSFNSVDRTLLDDIISFVYSGKNCKLILIGDDAQLPPVNSNLSPALDLDYLKIRYPLLVHLIELKEVTRQSLDSGILKNATRLRGMIEQEVASYPVFNLEDHKDVYKPLGAEIEESLSSCYSQDGLESTIIVCRSNKQANSYNNYIRFNVLFLEDQISSGDLLMVVKNNYYWLSEYDLEGFIANGDVIEILRVNSLEDKYGFRFANVTIRFTSEDRGDIELKILLDALSSEVSSLTREQNNSLYEKIAESYSYIKDRRNRLKEIKKDAYFNALQVKFSYAITCHKSQGGQWKNVFVDQGYLTEEMIDKEYLRWLYTAITRAQESLYLLNFHDRFFELED